MATCRYCGRGGLLRQVDPNGLCSGCAPVVILSIKSKVRVISESLVLAQNGKSLRTRLGRWDLVIERARGLLPYEVKGIPTIEPLPSALIAEAIEKRQVAVVTGVLDAIQQASAKAPAQRARAAAKVRDLIVDLRSRYGADADVDESLRLLDGRLDAWVE